ncbi:hypothetical protein D3C81_1451570 [compost metagenome]
MHHHRENRFLDTHIGRIQPIALHLVKLFELVVTSHQGTQTTPGGWFRLPGLQFLDMALAKQGDQLGIGLVGLHPLQLTLRVAGDSRGVDHADPIPLSEHIVGKGLVIDIGRFHDDPGAGFGMRLQPLSKGP